MGWAPVALDNRNRSGGATHSISGVTQTYYLWDFWMGVFLMFLAETPLLTTMQFPVKVLTLPTVRVEQLPTSANAFLDVVLSAAISDI